MRAPFAHAIRIPISERSGDKEFRIFIDLPDAAKWNTLCFYNE